MKRLVLRFRENEFNVAVQKYGNRTRIEREIKKELKKLLPKYKVTDPYFNNCKKNFYKELGKAYPKHLELMKVEKIPFMIDLETDKLFKLIDEYETKPSAHELAPNEVKSPSINQFEDVAETQEEIDKFEAVMNVLKVIEEAESVLNIEVYRGNIMQAFKGWLYSYPGASKLWFNFSRIAEERVRRKRELLST